MKEMSRYIGILISTVLWLLPFSEIYAVKGEKKDSRKGVDTTSFYYTEPKCVYGFFVDVDLVDPLRSAFSSSRSGFNVSAGLDINHTFMPALEVGYADIDASEDYSYAVVEVPQSHVYRVSGTYFKLGADFNLLNKKPYRTISPMGYLGFRYVISPYKYEVKDYVVVDAFRGENKSFSAEGNVLAQWGEVVAGLKTPVFRYLCVGLELHYKTFLHCQKKESFVDDARRIVKQSYAPGFGDFNDGVWGFRYTISYFFHL